MKRSELPRLKVAMRQLQKVGDVGKVSKAYRDTLTNYNTALQTAALKNPTSVGAIRRNIMNGVEIASDVIAEEVVELTENYQPPQVLVLRRIGIRIFPDGNRVALYTNERTGATFSVPYTVHGITKGGVPNVTSEEVEDVMENLDQVAKYAQQDNVTSHAKHFKFADGSKLKVSHGAAKAIHMVHNALNDENKKKFADMLTTPKGFEKAAHFALSKVNFTINK